MENKYRKTEMELVILDSEENEYKYKLPNDVAEDIINLLTIESIKKNSGRAIVKSVEITMSNY